MSPSERETPGASTEPVAPDPTRLHALALERMAAGEAAEAARLLAAALGLGETAERWNDWATVQASLGGAGHLDEAVAGYERALELAPDDAQAGYNLGVARLLRGEVRAALPLLRRALPRLGEEDAAHAGALLEEHAAAERDAGVDALGAWAPEAEGPSRDYFRTHRDRYEATLELLPAARPGEALLELGASFHHLTPALEAKGYAVRCADRWDGPATRSDELGSAGGGPPRRWEVDNFDLERPGWPYPDAAFDVVVCCEILEHLGRDPMSAMAEIHRVLKPGGRLLLTTPNLASAKSVASALEGESPYVFGQFVPGGAEGDRHHREYTAVEIERLLGWAGLEPLLLRTRNHWWKDRNAVLAKLVAGGHRIGRRGDDVLALARKVGPVRERYPQDLYCATGCHAGERAEVASAKPRRVLIVHDVLPHHDRSGSDLRILQVIRRLRAAGHEVTYIGRNGADAEKYRPALEELGVEVYAHDAERLGALGIEAAPEWSLADVLRARRPEVAILFHWFWGGLSVPEQYLDDVRRLSPETRIVVLTDDRHGLRELRGAELTRLFADRERAADYTARELECYRQADLLAAITEDDRRGLQEAAPELEIELLPMTAEVGEPGPGFEPRRGFAFLGNFENLANRDGMRWFLDEVWPRIRRRLPDAQLHLSGHGIPEEYGTRRGVVLVGHVPDVARALSGHRVFVSPIRFGTGIKTKNLSAMGSGLPMVTTTIGAEGMNLVDGLHACIADGPEEFARAAVALHQDRARWEAMAAAGRRHIEEEFSIDRLDRQLARLLARALERPPRAHDPTHRYSARLVEEFDPNVLSAVPAHTRLDLRLRAYLQLAEERSAAGRPGEALAQLRHMFHWIRGGVPRNLLMLRALTAMERCSRALGDAAEAGRCAEEARTCLPKLDRKLARARPPAVRPGEPALSVVLPTYNRKATLARCLEALAAQTLPADRFEVVVVDDGSTDGTAEALGRRATPFALTVVTQPNAGAGAARRLGVERARGAYLLLINDDTIADPRLLAEHLRLQQELHGGCFAVLGAFAHGPAGEGRALTWFADRSPMIFPQVAMRPDAYHGAGELVTCNLSIRRDAVLAAGSFDPALRVGEDSELGLRLAALGVCVLYAPSARALHDHLDLTVADLVRRARAYGPAWLRILEKHPGQCLQRLGLEVRAPVTDAVVARIRAALAPLRPQAEEMVAALKAQEALDFGQVLALGTAPGSPADKLRRFLHQVLPPVHWFHVLDGLCDAWEARAAAGATAGLLRPALVPAGGAPAPYAR